MIKKISLKVGLKHKNRKISLEVHKCGFFGELFGLMFKKKENAEALLFDFSGRRELALHSFFVFFPFLALWLDDKNRIVEMRTIKSFSFNIISKKRFSRIVEIPSNKKYSKIIQKLTTPRRRRERFK